MPPPIAMHVICIGIHSQNQSLQGIKIPYFYPPTTPSHPQDRIAALGSQIAQRCMVGFHCALSRPPPPVAASIHASGPWDCCSSLRTRSEDAIALALRSLPSCRERQGRESDNNRFKKKGFSYFHSYLAVVEKNCGNQKSLHRLKHFVHVFFFVHGDDFNCLCLRVWL